VVDFDFVSEIAMVVYDGDDAFFAVNLNRELMGSWSSLDPTQREARLDELLDSCVDNIFLSGNANLFRPSYLFGDSNRAFFNVLDEIRLLAIDVPHLFP